MPLLKAGAYPNATFGAGVTLLMGKVYGGDVQAVKALLDAGALPDTVAHNGMTALLLASQMGNAAIVQALLDANASLYPFGGGYAPAVFIAAELDHEEVVGVLVDAGVNLNANLHISAEEGAAPLVRAMLHAGADVNSVNRDGFTALMLAAENGHDDAVGVLLDADADIHARVPPPTMDSHTSFPRLQYANGQLHVSVNCLTAAQLAVVNGHRSVVETLMEVGADLTADARTMDEMMRAALFGPRDSMDAVGQARLARPAPWTEPVIGGAPAQAQAHAHPGDVVAQSPASGPVQAIIAMPSSGAAPSGHLRALHTDARQAHCAPAAAAVATASLHTVHVAQANPMTLLMGAAREGRLDMVERVLERGLHVDAVDDSGRTALLVAAEAGHADIALALLNAGANPDVVLTGGVTALMTAAYGGFDGVVAVLGAFGANTNAVHDTGHNALMVAAYLGHIGVVNELLEAGADPNMLVLTTTALQRAAQQGHADIVAALVTGGATLHPGGGAHAPALWDAALGHHQRVVDVLVKAGVDLNANLLIAAQTGMVHAVRALLLAGADVNGVDDAGQTALMRAAAQGHTETVTALVLGHADIQADLWAAVRLGSVAMVKAMVDAGANIEALGPGDRTPLMLAAWENQPAMVTALLNAGAQVQTTGDNGVSALMVAVRHGHMDVLNTLLAAGAPLNAVDSGGYTALMLAALLGNAAAAVVLVRAEADINVISREGWSARALADHFGHSAVAHLLNDAQIAQRAAAAETFVANLFVDDDAPQGVAQATQVAAPVLGGHALPQWDDLMERAREPADSAQSYEGDTDEQMKDMDVDGFQAVELVGVTQPS